MSVLSRLLLNREVVSREQLAEAIEAQVVYGGRLGTNLIELGYATEDAIGGALAEQYGIPYASLAPGEVDLDLVEEITPRRCEHYKVFPHSLTSKTLKLLMVDPSDHVAKAEISYGTGYIVRPLVTPEYRMLRLLEKHCGVSPQWRYEDRDVNYISRASRARTRVGKGTAQPTEEMPTHRDPLDRDTAAARLQRAHSRDEVIDVILRYARNYCERAFFYIVRRNYVLGWDLNAPGLDRRLVRSQVFPLEEPSVFKTVYENPGPFVGQLPRTAANDLLRKTIEKRSGNALVLPVVLAARVVNLLYCDNGPSGDISEEIHELIGFMHRVEEAYARIIRRRVRERIEQVAK